MSALADDRPEPGSFASSALDLALVDWRQKPYWADLGATVDDWSHVEAVALVDAARRGGHSLHEALQAVARRLRDIAALLPPLPSEEELEAELTTLASYPETEEPTRG